jgi:hypothetical protein
MMLVSVVMKLMRRGAQSVYGVLDCVSGARARVDV